MPNITPIEVCALFPEQKLQEYKDIVSFENYLHTLEIPDVIKVMGIDAFYLNKTSLKIHPHDILVQDSNLLNMQDSKYKELFAPYPMVFKVDITVIIGELLIPLTQAFNHRFEMLPAQWLREYLMTICDKDVTEQDRISLENFCQIQKVPDDDCLSACKQVINKYVLAVTKIKPSMVKDVQYIKNPFYDPK